jgi:acyl CoA:acetate/3-ketoacid CoA transferase
MHVLFYNFHGFQALQARLLRNFVLTLVSIVSLGDWAETGFNLLAYPGLARRVISAGFNNCPRIAELAIANESLDLQAQSTHLTQRLRDAGIGE